VPKLYGADDAIHFAMRADNFVDQGDAERGSCEKGYEALMGLPRYELPSFLTGRVTSQKYSRWLTHKAATHAKRDRKRLPSTVVISDYKQKMHKAVCGSDGIDWYTGEKLDWEKIGTYNNDQSKANRSHYKAGLALLPTIDHVLGENSVYDFVICGWRTNDAKNDLNLVEFLDVCRKVVARHGSASL
jgi:hypothetical protein